MSVVTVGVFVGIAMIVPVISPCVIEPELSSEIILVDSEVVVVTDML